MMLSGSGYRESYLEVLTERGRVAWGKMVKYGIRLIFSLKTLVFSVEIYIFKLKMNVFRLEMKLGR